MKTKPTHKTIAIFLTINFLTSLLPVNLLFANTNGPKAPEAAGFEPVDATDMVNLVTGDFTYVLPLLNVPSPEGGYPLSLGYHAGIAMDQEASWVGLGWNLNPGAINRNVNGYPDDYNSSLLTEYFYDEGGQSDVYSLSIGYSIGAASAGLGFSWGSDRAFGGSVNIGYGVGSKETGRIGGNLSIGTNGVGLGLGVTSAGGLSMGVKASSSGNLGGSLGFDNNGEGFSLGYSTQGGFSGGLSFGENGKGVMDVSISSTGVGFSYGERSSKTVGPSDSQKKVAAGGGIGLSLAFSNSVDMGNYTTKTSGWTIPLFVPIGPGFLSLSFGKQRFRYYLSDKENNYVSGPLYFSDGVISQGIYQLECFDYDDFGTVIIPCYSDFFDSSLEAQEARNNSDCDFCEINVLERDDAFMDMYEFTLNNNNIEDETDITQQNLSFPSYDIYNVQAQGISGNMSAKLWKNGALFGLSNKETEEDYNLNYTYDGADESLPIHVKFEGAPYFQFDNEINTYLEVNPANLSTFNTNGDVSTPVISPGDLYDGGVNGNALDRRVTSNHIAYYTNGEIVEALENGNSVLAESYLGPGLADLNRQMLPEDGIGGFIITAPDGKTYHYSVPVYNHETVVRTFGLVDNSPLESDSYMEKRQLEPYATHWLLTAITGPDYMDDGDNVADEGDLGYWVHFDYGKWSEAFVWKSPYAQDYLENRENQDIKTWIRGRKELYYLDAVKTRTHTALFVKSQRSDAPSPEWVYESVAHDGSGQNSNDYAQRFTIPSQNQLRLDKIILLKNEDAQGFSKNSASIPPSAVQILYNDSAKPEQLASFNLGDNVYDVGDNITEDNAIKVVDFAYDPNNSLKSGQGSLTLEKVNFKGKSGLSVLPPYEFQYNLIPESYLFYTFNIEDKDGWGYHKDDNSVWSLNQITTPQGGQIQIGYEENSFIPVIKSTIKFAENTGDFNLEKISETEYEISTKYNLGLELNESLTFVSRDAICRDIFSGFQRYICQKQEIPATLTGINGNNTYTITLDNPVDNCGCTGANGYLDYITYAYAELDYGGRVVENGGGIRVANITATDGVNSYVTKYDYGSSIGNGLTDGVGYVSYLPYAPELQEEIPYAQELPSPKVMYEYVTMTTLDTQGQQVNGKMVYKFNVLKNKDQDKIKFGDFFEIEQSTAEDLVYVNGTPIYNYIGEYTIKDNLAAIGQLLEVSSYNNQNHLMSKMVNHYYGLDETPNLLGVTQESYQNYKYLSFESSDDLWNVASASTRITYPNLSKGTTEYRDGYVFNTSYTAIDENVGQATVIETTNSENQGVRSTTVPAYTKYPDMASKLINADNKNMLTQEALMYTELQEGGEWKKVAADITSWKPFPQELNAVIDMGPGMITFTNQKDIWRKHKTFIWDGDTDSNGFFLNYSLTDDSDGFDWSAPDVVQPAQWKQLSEITQYNEFSAPIEVKDINGNHASTKMGYNDTKILVVSNAAYDESFYSGAEDNDGLGNFGGNVTQGTAQDTNTAHTGEHALVITPGQDAYVVTVNHESTFPKKFKASLWAQEGNHDNTKLKVDGVIVDPQNGETVSAGGWVQLNFYVDLTSGSQVSVTASGGSTIVDDFRLHPTYASMTSYVYNDQDELSHILGANNLGTRYEYDCGGRLIKVFSEVVDTPGLASSGFKLTNQYAYTYKRGSNCDDDEGDQNSGGGTYPPLSGQSIGVANFNTETTNITANVNGGSGQFEYRWSIKYCTDPNPADASVCPGNLTPTYGNWGSSNTQQIQTSCENGTRAVYWCQIRDVITGNGVDAQGNHKEQDCNNGGGDDQNPQQ